MILVLLPDPSALSKEEMSDPSSYVVISLANFDEFSLIKQTREHTSQFPRTNTHRDFVRRMCLLLD